MQLFIATVITRALLASASEHTFSWCILPTAFCPPCWVIPLQLLLLLLLLILLVLLLILLLMLLVLLVMLLLLLLLDVRGLNAVLGGHLEGIGIP